ncbi:MAG: anhydro-N-acetylmuramic acid kinase [Paracoccaceae bacterium]
MSQSEPLWALGAMSGTSLDGVDAAMILTDGVTVFEFGAHAYRPYSEAERAVIRAGFGKRSGAEVEAAAEVVETAHAEVLDGFSDVDVIGFHGQTLTHAPEDRFTLQAGNGALLAKVLGAPVVWDFRTSDVELGGQGAPLAPFYHFALARFVGATEPLAFLNLGGVGNLTWIDPTASSPDDDGACLAFDTGPANALIDDLILERTGDRFDTDGAIAASGAVDQTRLDQMLEVGFFSKMPPKSLDRNDFSRWSNHVEVLSTTDAAATLTAATAASVALGMEHCPTLPSQVLVTGGGRKNAALMTELAERLPCPVAPVEDVGLNGDMLEAQAFAYLAVRVMRKMPTSAPGTTGVAAPVGGGKISRPSA